MKHVFIMIVLLETMMIPLTWSSKCGCKETRRCYKKMLESLMASGEVECVENAAVGTATTTVFLAALQKFCGHLINVHGESLTEEGRLLYEVIINSTRWGNDSRATIILEAGQDAGVEPVGFALYLIEQLIACIEYVEMIRGVRWVILPSTNPDGLEMSRTKREFWKKNFKSTDTFINGVDITRNFDDSWSLCPANENKFSQDYPGTAPTTESETIFISQTLSKYKEDIKAYVSFRRDGHALLYPFASVNSSSTVVEKPKELANIITGKVNQKAGVIQWFRSESIFEMNGEPHCGHSVDYAFNKLDIANAFEMRMFLESDNDIISSIQPLPKGYDSSLRTSYFNGIKELYKNIVKKED